MNKEKKQKPPLPDYARYSSLGFQMMIIILIGTFAGIKLDKWLSWEFPIGKLVFPILSVFFSLFIVFKDLLKKK